MKPRNKHVPAMMQRKAGKHVDQKKEAKASSGGRVDICYYCGEAQGDRLACCGETHFFSVDRDRWDAGEEISSLVE